MLKTKSLDDSIDSREPKICVYGAAGAGKTRLISTLPGRVLVASAEAGLLSLKRLPAADRKRIEVIEVKSVVQLKEIHAELSKPKHGFDWLCLDSVSEIAEITLTELKRKNLDKRAAYGDVVDDVVGMMRSFRDLPMGVYFAAKERKHENKETGRITYSAAMPGQQLGPSIPYLFDEMFRLTVFSERDENGKTSEARWLLTANDGRSDAKDRSGALDPYEEPHLGNIAEKIRGAPPAAEPESEAESQQETETEEQETSEQ